MPAIAKIDRSVKITTAIPESSMALLIARLYSPVEGRVPKGAYQDFFVARIQEFFSWRRLDLAPYGFPAGNVITGPKEVIDLLEERLAR